MKIDFHVLEEASNQRAWHYACQLLEKAHSEQRKVFIYMNSDEEAERLDTLLWTYKEDSFIPHHLYNLNEEFPAKIQIASKAPATEQTDLLLNLSKELPAFYTQFSHVIEIVFSDPHVQQLARERFKQYREQGHEINTYKTKL